MNDLEFLAQKHGTDKQEKDHGYTKTYYELFKDRREEYKDILELGIWFGASHKMWKDFFPNAEVYGVDNFSGLGNKYQTENPDWTREQIIEKLNEKVEELRDYGISVTISDQMDREFLENIFSGIWFDVIIDDGGHASWQHQISFSFLWDMVQPGGYYIIEDLATCLQREFRQFDDIRSSTITWLNSMMTDVPFSYYMKEDQLKKIQSEIESIEFVGELGIIKKK